MDSYGSGLCKILHQWDCYHSYTWITSALVHLQDFFVTTAYIFLFLLFFRCYCLVSCLLEAHWSYETGDVGGLCGYSWIMSYEKPMPYLLVNFVGLFRVVILLNHHAHRP